MLRSLIRFLTPSHKFDAEPGTFVSEVFVGEAKAREIIQRTIILGNPVDGRILTAAQLAEAGLLPAYGILFKNSFGLFFSKPFYEPRGRLAVVGYVAQGRTYIVSSYYLSNSHGVWRYLVDYTFDEEGLVSNYGKGYGEESVTLSYVFQKILARMSSFPKYIHAKDAQTIFFGTTKRHGRGTLPMYEKVYNVPQRLEGTMYHSNPLAKIDPRHVQFTLRMQIPNFSCHLTSWQQRSPLYGNITANVFSSHDRTLLYTVCEDTLKRVWIGAVENTSKLLPLGLRAQWVKGGALTTPAYEYLMPEVLGQPPQYGNKQLTRGSYVDMYERYISKIPIIQEYRAYDGN